MDRSRHARQLRLAACVLASILALSVAGTLLSQAAGEEQAVWNLEHAYWRYVEANDLTSYLKLWNENFLGWPSVSAAPVHKDHITDWITSQTSQGLTFKTVAFKPAAIQVTGNVAVTTYWLTYQWRDSHGQGPTSTVRILHAWLKGARGWQIIGGMSMPEPGPQE